VVPNRGTPPGGAIGILALRKEELGEMVSTAGDGRQQDPLTPNTAPLTA
jgi:hypothetical protein